jgi:hypothetical protein
MKKSLFYSFLYFTFLTISCNSTKLINTWKQPDRHVHMNGLSKVLVIALIENQTNSYKAEDEIVSHLNGKGFASHEYFDESFKVKNGLEILEKFKEDEFDGIVFMRLIDIDNEEIYIPKDRYYCPNDYDNFGDHYLRKQYQYLLNENYIIKKTYVIETTIFSFKDDTIIWTGVTETFDPTSIKKMTHKISKVVYNKMVEEGFIRK